ncbi:LppX_LprAFG lipoprotein [Nocardia jejuensis]|uniref:LppX_LprAFG lipoprotein n=1 Tax=Nocardia jejuensis TaxID=328049 RepID=UPI0024817A25|nr:LppX_LprAFG lipoprotein [Nocardia jejuensis]
MTRGRGSRFGRTSRKGLVPALMAASVFAALVTGCSSNDDSTTTSSPAPTGALPDGAQIVQESSRTTQTLQYVHMGLAVKNIPSLPVETVSADVTNQPQGAGQAKGDAKVRLKPDADFTQTKFLVVDKTLYAGDGSTYSKVGDAVQIYDPGVILDKDKGIANVIANVQNPKVESREKVNGVDTVKVTGTIEGTVIDPIVPKIGEKAGTLPITLWIQDVAPPSGSATTLPSTAASPGTGPNLVQAVITKDSGNVTVTLSDWGKKFEVVKPGN